MLKNGESKAWLIEKFMFMKVHAVFGLVLNYLLGQEPAPSTLAIDNQHQIYMGLNNDYPTIPLCTVEGWISTFNTYKPFSDEEYEYIVTQINCLPTKFEIGGLE
jgi:hypothetical protein